MLVSKSQDALERHTVQAGVTKFRPENGQGFATVTRAHECGELPGLQA